MWEINKDNVGPNYMKELDKLERELVIATLFKDMPEWMGYKSLIDGYKMDSVLIPKQIDKIKKSISEH